VCDGVRRKAIVSSGQQGTIELRDEEANWSWRRYADDDRLSLICSQRRPSDQLRRPPLPAETRTRALLSESSMDAVRRCSSPAREHGQVRV